MACVWLWAAAGGLATLSAAEDPAQAAGDAQAPAEPNPDVVAGQVQAPTPDPAPAGTSPPPAQADAQNLAELQGQLASRFKRFEDRLLRLAEDAAVDDPDRAALLRKAVARSKELLLGIKLDRISELLAGDQLASAARDQAAAMAEMRSLLEMLLSEDRADSVSQEKRRLAEYLKQVGRLIQQQQALEGQTQDAADPARLAGKQQDLADKTGQLSDKIKDDQARERPAADQPAGGKPMPSGQENQRPEGSDDRDAPGADSGESAPGESPDEGSASGAAPHDANQSPSGQPGEAESSEDPAQPDGGGAGSPEAEAPQAQTPQRLDAAGKSMRSAKERLEAGQRQAAQGRQQEALRELEAAKAELEKTLQQLRQEELERTLVQLEERYRRMLEVQRRVLDGTVALDEVPAADRQRSHQLEAARLAQQESKLVLEAEKALNLIAEDGSSVAFAEATRQVRDDMQRAGERLARFDVGPLTQAVEEDIITTLEEMLAAIAVAQEELAQQQQMDAPPPPSGDQPEQPLVDQLSELKLIRSLQLRVNRRTQQLGDLLDQEPAERAELLSALGELAEREARIHRATQQIVEGRNR